MRLVARWAHLLYLLLGGCLLWGVVWKLGAQNVVDRMAMLGWGILPVLCVSLAWKCSNTAAWRLAFPPDTNVPGFWRLFRVNLAGDVVNNLVPTGNLGGELAKPYLLRGQVPVSRALSSIVANKTMEVVSGFVFVALGVGGALLSLPLDGRIQIGLAAVVLLGGAGIGLACLAQRSRPFSRLLDLLRNLGVRMHFLDRHRATIRRVESGLAAFYGCRRSRLVTCLGMRLGSWALGALETFLIMRLMGLDLSPSAAFYVVALNIVIELTFFFVPGGLGTFEAGHAYLFFLMGLDPATGVSVALIKRFREVFWMGMGVALLYTQIPLTGVERTFYDKAEVRQTAV